MPPPPFLNNAQNHSDPLRNPGIDFVPLAPSAGGRSACVCRNLFWQTVHRQVRQQKVGEHPSWGFSVSWHPCPLCHTRHLAPESCPFQKARTVLRNAAGAGVLGPGASRVCNLGSLFLSSRDGKSGQCIRRGVEGGALSFSCQTRSHPISPALLALPEKLWWEPRDTPSQTEAMPETLRSPRPQGKAGGGRETVTKQVLLKQQPTLDLYTSPVSRSKDGDAQLSKHVEEQIWGLLFQPCFLRAMPPKLAN